MPLFPLKIPNSLFDVLVKEIDLEIAGLIKTPLNAAFADYDPYMALFNSLGEDPYDHLNQAPQVIPPLRDEFSIALGALDDVGQITEILFDKNNNRY